MNPQSILSICIPTYNRAECLRQILDKMIPVCKENNILIYISDNASPDNTEEVGIKYASDYDFIHYHRHSENIGPDDNFEYVLKMADTKYRWLMSDTCYVDDIVDLKKDLNLSKCDGYILGSPGDRGDQLPKEKLYFQESISLMREIGWHLSWISCMIYSQEMIETFDFKRYRDSSFNQTALMLDPIAGKECNVCFNPSVMVKNLSISKDSGWHYHVFDVMYRQWYLLIMALPLYYPYEIKKKCVTDSVSKALPLRIYFHAKRRVEGKWNVKDLIKNQFFIQQAKGKYYRLFLIGLFPPVVIRIVFSLGHYIRMVLRLGLKDV